MGKAKQAAKTELEKLKVRSLPLPLPLPPHNISPPLPSLSQKMTEMACGDLVKEAARM